jgi:hypothetical protein
MYLLFGNASGILSGKSNRSNGVRQHYLAAAPLVNTLYCAHIDESIAVIFPAQSGIDLVIGRKIF